MDCTLSAMSSTFLVISMLTATLKGNTPLHLALESGHAEVAVKLILAGADRERVRAFTGLSSFRH